MINYFCLIKFGKKEHIDILCKKGQIRFGSIASFAESIDKERGDKFEGAIKVINDYVVKVECKHPTLGDFSFTPTLDNFGTLIQYELSNHFLFSSYAITSNCFIDSDVHKISDKLMAFGEYALIIYEPILFINKIQTKLKELNIENESRLIEYLPIESKGEFNINLFNKTNVLHHQNEHRILIKKNQQSDSFFIELGSIEEYCKITKTIDLLNTEFKAKRKF